MKNLQYVWKKGKRKIVCEITPIDKYYTFQAECRMYSQMALAGFKLQKRS